MSDQEYAKRLAARIRAARAEQLRQATAAGHTKIAAAGQLRMAVARTAVGVVDEVRRSGVPAWEQGAQIALVEKTLGVRPGSLELVKRGSLQSLIDFDQAAEALYLQIIWD